jgi:DNA repair ATPase RecN
LKATKVDLLKDEQRLNEIVRDYEHRVDDLRYNDQEILKQESRLDKVNLQIDALQKDEANLQQDLNCQLKDAE